MEYNPDDFHRSYLIELSFYLIVSASMYIYSDFRLALRPNGETTRVHLVYSITLILNTTANVAEASRTKYQSNQMATFLLTMLGLELRWRIGKNNRLVVRRSGREIKK